MLSYSLRTDLAVEEIENKKDIGYINGITQTEREIEGFKITSVNIKTEQASEKIGKPQGIYETIEIDALTRHETDCFSRACIALSSCIKKLLPQNNNLPILVLCLGNKNITPDAIGPCTSEYILATRHLLKTNSLLFDTWRSVSVISAGVLGQTGIEIQEIACGIKEKINPCAVIAVDALASFSVDRLCKTIQLSNTGIIPGSGVQNSRAALNIQTLGIPVIAIGSPTVVDISKIFNQQPKTPLFVTTRDIDKHVCDISRVIGYALNMAFQPNLTVEQIDLYLS